MGLHAILEQIRSSGDQQVHEIERRAHAQAHEILVSARLEAEQVSEQACEKVLEPVSHDRARLIHHARLEAMQIVAEARKELVDAALEQVRGWLINLRSDACYPHVLKQLMLEAVSELSDVCADEESVLPVEMVCLEANPKDQALLERLLESQGLALPVEYNLNCWGGVVAKGDQGRIVVINTLEARFERAAPYLRVYLAAFFENEHLTPAHEQPEEAQIVMGL